VDQSSGCFEEARIEVAMLAELGLKRVELKAAAWSLSSNSPLAEEELLSDDGRLRRLGLKETLSLLLSLLQRPVFHFWPH
jgi:hypothetical protein